jgi:protein TorT
MKRYLLAGVMGMLAIGAVQAADNWTYPVFVNEPPLLPVSAENVTSTPATYESLSPSEVTKKWNLCIAMPNMNDDYYVAMNYGAVEEAKRLGVAMTMVSAGGYVNLTKQISQVEDCIANGADAILIMAISPTGLNQVIKEAKAKGIVVVDLANGIESEDIQARSKASWNAIGAKLGEYLGQRHPAGSGKVQVLWLPGPAGASWSEDMNRGFQDALKAANADVEIVATQYGDMQKNDQMKLVEDGLATYPELVYIAGSSQAAEAAMQIIREQGREDKIQLLSAWITPFIAKAIEDGKILATVTDATVIQARIGIDQAVRILEGKEVLKDVEPEIIALDAEVLKTFDKGNAIAPAGWNVTFQVD